VPGRFNPEQILTRRTSPATRRRTGTAVPVHQKTYAAQLSTAVKEICRKQAEIGVDIMNDGEFGKTTRGPIDYGAWSSYAWGRLSGWQPGEPGRLWDQQQRDCALADRLFVDP
jgi:5-methyltetrahydropteroyltriglutamate--homocysteine methyltransferase